MKTGILGTGMVGQTIGSKLIQNGHSVRMGSRQAANEKAMEWVKQNGENASHGTFAEAARFGEILFNCTSGMYSLHALEMAGADNLKGKILIDVANPLDFSQGMPPTLAVCNTDSLGEQIQRTFPEVKVVKALNTMNCYLMVNPDLLTDQHDAFVSGDDAEAKITVTEFLQQEFGWKSVIDLGNIRTARGVEMLLPLWLQLYGKFKSSNFNFHIVH